MEICEELVDLGTLRQARAEVISSGSRELWGMGGTLFRGTRPCS
jgi:hypothetical protein